MISDKIINHKQKKALYRQLEYHMDDDFWAVGLSQPVVSIQWQMDDHLESAHSSKKAEHKNLCLMIQ